MSYVPPKKGAQYIFYVGLWDYSDASKLKSAPTLASGDFQISKDGGAFANLASLPTVAPADGTQVKVIVSSTEMDADNVLVKWSDADDEWCDGYALIQTAAQQMDDLAVPGEYDAELTAIQADLDDPDQYKADVSALATAVALAVVDANVDAILADTGTDGVVVGSHTTAAKAELQTEAEDALIANNLDHLMKTAVADDDDMTTEVPDGTVLSNIMTKDGDTSDFVGEDDSLEGIRDALRVTGHSISDGISGSNVTKKRGDYWSVPFTGDEVIGDISGYTKLWLTAKRDCDDVDSEAIFQILLTNPADGVNDGLKYLNGAAATDAQRTKCAIAVSDAATGAVTATFDEAITAEFGEEFLVYDWQALVGGNPTTKKEGNWTITADVTRAIA